MMLHWWYRLDSKNEILTDCQFVLNSTQAILPAVTVVIEICNWVYALNNVNNYGSFNKIKFIAFTQRRYKLIYAIVAGVN